MRRISQDAALTTTLADISKLVTNPNASVAVSPAVLIMMHTPLGLTRSRLSQGRFEDGGPMTVTFMSC